MQSPVVNYCPRPVQPTSHSSRNPLHSFMGCVTSCSLDACSDCLPRNPLKFSPLSQRPPAAASELGMDHFRAMDILGAGGFGHVKKAVKLRGVDAGHVFAIKIMRKDSLLARRKGVQCVLAELSILVELDHPFVCNVHYAFQDRRRLFLALDYCAGGDMRYNLSQTADKRFSEEAVRFYAAQLILALEYCHGMRVLHRDVKPENILLLESGYLKLTDFGVARRVSASMECESSSGTHGYMAPEIYAQPRHAHGPPADWFSLGVTLHEFATGRRPFETKLLRSCAAGSVQPGDFSLLWLHSCQYLSFECQNFIARLLHAHDSFRLTPRLMRAHPWLKGVSWARLAALKVTPPAGTLPDTAFLRSTLTAEDVERFKREERSADSIPPDKQLLFLDYHYRVESDQCAAASAAEATCANTSLAGATTREGEGPDGNKENGLDNENAAAPTVVLFQQHVKAAAPPIARCAEGSDRSPLLSLSIDGCGGMRACGQVGRTGGLVVRRECRRGSWHEELALRAAQKGHVVEHAESSSSIVSPEDRAECSALDGPVE